MRKEQSLIDQLPDEVLMHIFAYLGLVSITNAAMVQKRWHQLLCDESLWITILLRDFAPFYSNNAAVKSCTLSPHALYQKEHKMKLIILCMILDKTMPKVISKDDSLWETLYRRLFTEVKNQKKSWRQRFSAEVGDMRNLYNKIDLIVGSGYADKLQLFIDSIKNPPHEIEHPKKSRQNPKKSRRKRFQKKPVSKQAPQPTLHELINKRRYNGISPLYIAAFMGHLDIAKLLLKHHTNINQACNDGTTPLYIAAQEGHFEVVQLLLDHHANVNLACIDGVTALFVAAQGGHLATAKLLLDHHANVNQAMKTGETPLFIAAQESHHDMVRLLIDHHANVNQARASDDGATPLFISAFMGHLKIAKILLNHQANVNQARTSSDGATPLFMAAQEGHPHMVRLLLNHGANVNQADNDGGTPLYIAAQEGHLKITSLLLDHYANINQTCDDGATPLYIAAQEGHLKIAKFLLDRHANVNQACNNGETPLYIAAYKGHLDIVKLLIQHGAHYNQIPASLIRKYPKVNTCYQKAQTELLKEQQSLSTQTTLFPVSVLNSANHHAINQQSSINQEKDKTSTVSPN